ncbi:MAG: type 2 isopentenyl-diphosphate Delta-isomerase, partial [Planctomycetota bacterium]
NEALASYEAKKFAPRLRLLLGNLGAVQLNYGVTLKDIEYLIESVDCDAFTFHLNPLQEAIQPEGDRNFKGLVEKLAEIIPQIKVPVCIKEVGAGISRRTALKIRSLPVASVEVAGVGGTSWAYIEAMRQDDPIARATGIHLKSFGVPTAKSIQICREVFPDKYIVGSGGIRTGLDAAKALALGADMVAFALPMLKAAEFSYEEMVLKIRQMIHELKTVMFITGSKKISELRERIFPVQD